jgi:hypothetical protein
MPDADGTSADEQVLEAATASERTKSVSAWASNVLRSLAPNRSNSHAGLFDCSQRPQRNKLPPVVEFMSDGK